MPQISNREDFLLTVSLWDDDTGQPVRFDGTQTALPQPFTSAAWTVVDGAIITTSTTGITIPVFPIANQLTALALVVGKNLAIAPGDPVTIYDTATGLNRMTGYVVSYGISTGFLVVQIGCSFLFEIRRTGAHYDGSGYIPWYDFGIPDEHGPLLQATLGTGIQIIDIGVIQIMIPAAAIQKLRNGTYSAALIVTDSVNTRQMFIGQLPVQWGAVTRGPVNAAAGAFSAGFSGGFS